MSFMVKVKLLARFTVLFDLLDFKFRHFATGLYALLDRAALHLAYLVVRWEELLYWMVRRRLLGYFSLLTAWLAILYLA